MLKYSRTAIFIDGANLHATARALGFEIDYKRLLELFEVLVRQRRPLPL